VLVTGPDREDLVRMGRTLVEERLAACVNVLPGLTSVYRWKGRVQADAECLALVKTTADSVDRACRRLQELHPYELAECVALPVVSGSPSYLRWVAECVGVGENHGVEA
jgi:periplasmic divalent cation tolerance protein